MPCGPLSPAIFYVLFGRTAGKTALVCAMIRSGGIRKMSAIQIRVMLVDAHRLVVSGLQRLINDEKPTMAVVATANNCETAIKVVDEARPDVIVVGSRLVKDHDAAVVPKLINGSNRRVLLLDAENDEEHDIAILRGAFGVVRNSDSPEILIKAIRKVHEGQLWLDRTATGRLFVQLSKQHKALAKLDPNQRRVDSLTTREHQVVCTFLAQPGADNKTLANNLHIGEHTLRNHLSRIYDKLGVPNRVELYVFAQRHGLAERAEV
jgi:two-component system, NarL family, nitrate/nitrite response regulator NarL